MAGGKQTEEHKKKLSESGKRWWDLNRGTEAAYRRRNKISATLKGQHHIPPNKGILTGIYKICPECNSEFYVEPSAAETRIFCCYNCHLARLRREGSHLRKPSAEHKSTSIVKQRLLEEQKVCDICGFEDTRILQLHHKDMDHGNNAEENLQMICPNCHAQIHYDAKNGMYHNLK